MNRYISTPIITTQENPIRRYTTIRYPKIELDSQDIYVYTTIGDRYDTLANIYYKDPSLWWIIVSANQEIECDSLIPPIGYQLRIPSPNRLPIILGEFEITNAI